MVVPGAHHVGDLPDLLDRLPRGRPAGHDDDPVRAGEQGGRRVERQRPAHDDERGAGLLPPLLPRGDDVLGGLDRPVALVAGRPGPDEDGVGETPQVVEHLPVHRRGQ